MFEGINEIALLVTTIIVMGVGSVWYSPVVFGKVWMRSLRLPEDSVETQSAMLKSFILSGLCNLLVLYVLAHALIWVRLLGVSVLEFSLWLTALVSGLAVSSALWEQKPLSYILINLGYTAIVIIGGLHVIAYWPW